MAAVAQVLRIPDVCHENILGAMKHLFLGSSFHLIYIGALSAEGLVGSLATARVRELFPRTIDVFCLKHAGCVRIPSRTSARNHPICVILLEDSWSFVLPTCCNSYVASVVSHIVICQLCNL